MAVGKEIRGKIKSVENTRKITKAMEMVAASKMRKAQERMRAARPYAERIASITGNLSKANPEYRSPYMREVTKTTASNVGFIVITTDKGLCGGMNTNILRALTSRCVTCRRPGQGQRRRDRQQGLRLPEPLRRQVVSHATQLGDAPQLDKLIGPVQVMLQQFVEGKLDAVHLCFTRFINTMKQEPQIVPLLPLTSSGIQSGATTTRAAMPGTTSTNRMRRA